MPDNITPLDLAKRLADGVKCGTCGGPGRIEHEGGAVVKDCPTCNGDGVERYPQDAWPQLVWAWTMDEEGLDLFAPMWWDRLIVGPEWYAAPHVADSILWLLGTEAWRRSRMTGTLVLRATGQCYVMTIPPLRSDTPIDLLRAMLDAVSKEATA